MVSGTHSEQIVDVALWVGVLALVLTFTIFIVILAMRLALFVRQARKKRFLDTWRPLLSNALVGLPVDVPRVGPRDRVSFLTLWNRYHGFLRGESGDTLNAIFRKTGLHEELFPVLESGNVGHRLVAIETVGNLEATEYWKSLKEIAVGDQPFTSIGAIRAMTKIHPHKGIKMLVSMIGRRLDWPRTSIELVLKEAGSEVATPYLIHQARRESPEALVRLLPFLRFAYKPAIIKTVRSILETVQESEVIASCLKLLDDPTALHLVREYQEHPSWPVRVQVASILGRIGGADDAFRLVGMLSDREWWVRYRAAQSLAAMPFISLEGLAKIKDMQEDPYARDILTQMIAEKSTS